MEKRQNKGAIIVEKCNAIFYSRKCAIFNAFMWILMLVLIVSGVKRNSLSHYEQAKFDKVGMHFGILPPADPAGFFKCGWGEYSVQIDENGDILPIICEKWSDGNKECLRLTDNYNNSCNWMHTPDQSGFIWCICNIIGGMVILMGLLLHILSVFDTKLTFTLYTNGRMFRIIFILSLIATISIFIATFNWFNMNSKYNGCWSDNYEYILDSDSNAKTFVYDSFQFENKQLGFSMICDLCALSVISIFMFLYCFLSCQCSNKSSRFIKDRINIRQKIQNEKILVQMLQIDDDEVYQGEIIGNSS